MTTAEPETVRLHGSDGILSAIPAVLGFHPVDSVVVAGLIPVPRRSGTLRVGPVSRTDLDEFETSPLEVAATTAVALRFGGVTQTYIVTYGRTTDTEQLLGALGAAGIGVIGILHVGNSAQPIDTQLHAAAVAIGMVIEDDREALVARVEHFKGAPPMPEVLNRLRTPEERDRYVGECMRDRDNALPILLAACRGAMDDCLGDETQPAEARLVVANLAAATAIIAYRQGSGPLAGAALDRALRVDPSHRLAILLRATFSAGMPPEYLDNLAELH